MIHPLKIQNSMIFSIFRFLPPSPVPKFRIFLSPPKEIPYPLAVISHSNPLTVTLHPTHPYLFSLRPPLIFLSLHIFLFLIFYINKITQYVVFYDWLLILSIMFSKPIHVVA